MTRSHRRILVTSALPYANGPIHLGHLVEYIQADIWTRYQRMQGHECYYVCADDAHGTPVMLHAEQAGLDPEQLIEQVSEQHQRDFASFSIGFDCYHSTHSEENRSLAEQIYLRLRDRGYIRRRTIKQLYDPDKEMFLPDRFIRGECPNCHAPDQYGDGCEVCNKTYRATELLNPFSVISGTRPVERESEHLFFALPRFEKMLKSWVQGEHLQTEVINKLEEWFRSGLQEWDISRDAPYFGFEIPQEPGKFFYVWLDAPIGYLASLRRLCAQKGLDFDSLTRPDTDTELYHFIGKDIMYFHCLFWPAMLHGSDFRLPTAIFIHGFLTVNGQKMSKTRGTFIKAETYLKHLNPEYLRYYFAAKLSNRLEDIDLNMEDFAFRINADLVGKVINIGSRCAGFINKRFVGHLSTGLHDESIFKYFVDALDSIGSAYEAREYARAMREIMLLADRANQYIDQHKPWLIAKKAGCDELLQMICTMGINLFRLLMIGLKPVLPVTVKQAEAFLCTGELDWGACKRPLLDHTIRPFTPLMTRVIKEDIAAMIEDSKHDLQQNTDQGPHLGGEPIMDLIDIEAFGKVDLRIAKIVEADYVSGADRLLRLVVDIGGQTRTIFAGIRSAYQPADLVGKLTVVVANLRPRKLRFGTSEGMLLAAGTGGQDLFLLKPDEGASPGMRIK